MTENVHSNRLRGLLYKPHFFFFAFLHPPSRGSEISSNLIRRLIAQLITYPSPRSYSLSRQRIPTRPSLGVAINAEFVATSCSLLDLPTARCVRPIFFHSALRFPVSPFVYAAGEGGGRGRWITMDGIETREARVDWPRMETRSAPLAT